MYFKLVSLLLVFLTTATCEKSVEYQLVKKGITEIIKTNNVPDYFLKAAEKYQLPHILNEGMEDVYDNEEACGLCDALVGAVILERQAGADRDVIAGEVEFICIVLGIEDERVCKGVVQLNVDIFLYIMDNKPDLTAARVCGFVLQSMDCPVEDGEFEWSIEIPPGNSADRSQEPSDESFSILQVSDIHYDPLFKPYGNADCPEPICCQSDQGDPTSDETTCGYWTDYRDADTPWHLVEETVRQTNTQPFDYVYYTGDIISHRVWETSVETNTADITRIFNYFRDTYSVPVFPIFGNHEPHPLNAWTSEGVDGPMTTTWLFELAAELWTPWVGEEARETILRGGYYSSSPKPGFRVIGLNGNVCYTVNWWLGWDDVDPFGQLQWLADTLKAAEDADESVHILTHVPTGSSDCLKVWSREYRRIIERFANTITGQFNGHTHKDGFHIYYNSSEILQAVGVAFNGASVTPFSNNNPSYKLYQIDQTVFTILDFEEWTFNLTLANLQPSELPEWYQLYTFKEAYGVENLWPETVETVPVKMVADHTLLDKYFIYKYRNSDPATSEGCDENCKKDLLCEIVTFDSGDDTQCVYFKDLYDQST